LSCRLLCLNHRWVVGDTQKLVLPPVKYLVPYFGCAIKQLIQVVRFFQEFGDPVKDCIRRGYPNQQHS
jgi:hypothetical protein